MYEFPPPTPDDQRRFLLQLYFGKGEDNLLSCVKRAYRDFCRTLNGFEKIEKKKRKDLRNQAENIVRSFLDKLHNFDGDQSAFDKLHRKTCENLCSEFAEGGFPSFCVGQAQKWLNMALKYVFVFGEDLLPEYNRVRNLGHMPIDNVILDCLYPKGAPGLSTSWSQLSNYDKYLEVQKWVRMYFKQPSLDVEFHLFCQHSGVAELV